MAEQPLSTHRGPGAPPLVHDPASVSNLLLVPSGSTYRSIYMPPVKSCKGLKSLRPACPGLATTEAKQLARACYDLVHSCAKASAWAQGACSVLFHTLGARVTLCFAP